MPWVATSSCAIELLALYFNIDSINLIRALFIGCESLQNVNVKQTN